MDEEFEGYVTATPYTHVYYPESAPSRLQLITYNRSIPFPSSRPLRYLELGYGNGVSLNIHAAARRRAGSVSPSMPARVHGQWPAR